MSRIRAFIPVFLIVIFLAFGSGMVAASQPAGPGPWSNVKACFVYYNGALYKSKEMYLYQWNGSGWKLYRENGKSDDTGCGTFFNVDKNTYYYFQAYWTYNVGSTVIAYNGHSDAQVSGAAGTKLWGTFTVGWSYLYV
jgi:hypothetical protein